MRKFLSVKKIIGLITILAIISLVITINVFGLLYEEDTVVVQTAQNISHVAAIDCDINEGIKYYYYEDSFIWNPDLNNKFGLYIYAENTDFIDIAEKLVNSNGGDWGYVLIPYNVRDYNDARWEKVFSELYEKHLIPIIQLHDVNPDNYKEETKDAASFLDQFTWPVKSRYVSVYNEPNDAKFWYGRVDPKEYAEILSYTVDTFKEQNPNFFMTNGALNVSAHSSETYMDAFTYMREMNKYVPGIFDKLDGFASHSYPQPNFSGSPKDLGRNSVYAYDLELTFLKQELSVKKELPVFITETGWAHAEGETHNSSYLSVDEISSNFKKAFEEVWLKDDRVVAVTPFTIKYDPPFDHFSFVNSDNVPYKHYEVLKSIKKISGEPQSLKVGTLSSRYCQRDNE